MKSHRVFMLLNGLRNKAPRLNQNRSKKIDINSGLGTLVGLAVYGAFNGLKPELSHGGTDEVVSIVLAGVSCPLKTGPSFT